MKKGDKVLYVPPHAEGDTSHPDCERGQVTGENEIYVFVRYEGRKQAAATDPRNLVPLDWD